MRASVCVCACVCVCVWCVMCVYVCKKYRSNQMGCMLANIEEKDTHTRTHTQTHTHTLSLPLSYMQSHSVSQYNIFSHLFWIFLGKLSSFRSIFVDATVKLLLREWRHSPADQCRAAQSVTPAYIGRWTERKSGLAEKKSECLVTIPDLLWMAKRAQDATKPRKCERKEGERERRGRERESGRESKCETGFQLSVAERDRFSRSLVRWKLSPLVFGFLPFLLFSPESCRHTHIHTHTHTSIKKTRKKREEREWDVKQTQRRTKFIGVACSRWLPQDDY